MCSQTLWMSSTYQNKKTSSYKYGTLNSSFQVLALTVRAYTVSSENLDICVYPSNHGMLNPFEDPTIVTDSLTYAKWAGKVSLHRDNEMNAERWYVPLQVEIQRIKLKWAWDSYIVPFSTYPLVVIDTIGSTRTTRLRIAEDQHARAMCSLWLPLLHLLVDRKNQITGGICIGWLKPAWQNMWAYQ
jgi:hypothetical protein